MCLLLMLLYRMSKMTDSSKMCGPMTNFLYGSLNHPTPIHSFSHVNRENNLTFRYPYETY